MLHIGNILTSRIKRFSFSEETRQQKIEHILKARYEGLFETFYIKQNTLYIKAKSASDANALFFEKDKILFGVNKGLGENRLSAVRLIS